MYQHAYGYIDACILLCILEAMLDIHWYKNVFFSVFWLMEYESGTCQIGHRCHFDALTHSLTLLFPCFNGGFCLFKKKKKQQQPEFNCVITVTNFDVQRILLFHFFSRLVKFDIWFTFVWSVAPCGEDGTIQGSVCLLYFFLPLSGGYH